MELFPQNPNWPSEMASQLLRGAGYIPELWNGYPTLHNVVLTAVAGGFAERVKGECGFYTSGQHFEVCLVLYVYISTLTTTKC